MQLIRHFPGNRDTDSARLYLSCAAEGLREIFRSGPARRAQYRCELRASRQFGLKNRCGAVPF
jgi:hypothetical protein